MRILVAFSSSGLVLGCGSGPDASSVGGPRPAPPALRPRRPVAADASAELGWNIVRDARGVPHVFAPTVDDGFFGLGYATASDRLFQMNSRVASPRAGWPPSSVRGPNNQNLAHDVRMRTLGYEAHARWVAAKLPDDVKKPLEAFAAGVNAYMTSQDFIAARVRDRGDRDDGAVEAQGLAPGLGQGRWRSSATTWTQESSSLADVPGRMRAQSGVLAGSRRGRGDGPEPHDGELHQSARGHASSAARQGEPRLAGRRRPDDDGQARGS